MSCHDEPEGDRQVYLFRTNVGVEIEMKDLCPGDIFALSDKGGYWRCLSFPYWWEPEAGDGQWVVRCEPEGDSQ